MAESVTIARPYAEAVFRIAREQKTLPLWQERLERMALVAEDAGMQSLIGSPKVSPAQLAQLFVSLCGEAANPELGNFIQALVDNERLAVLPQIRDLYIALKSAEEGVKEAVIESAYPLDGAQLNNLTQQLEAHFGTRLQPRVVVQPELIGGVKVMVGDRMLDASVRGKLETVASALKN
ncbi:MAG: F0F1 ATP synthase subunit delta [Betaproteobacteria bacterium]|nr:F0F1 ATP synthase subunit delta [Betaproteobacteria bacterium]